MQAVPMTTVCRHTSLPVRWFVQFSPLTQQRCALSPQTAEEVIAAVDEVEAHLGLLDGCCRGAGGALAASKAASADVVASSRRNSQVSRGNRRRRATRHGVPHTAAHVSMLLPFIVHCWQQA